ncbi:unnamed protein product [Diatraea saccharalis]|uniref:Uncharacterized protein n=1 Tax=Diatraea saccharalis TaxID=40085 RepID=A0A9N9QTH4_9NEOP|nr:unnamed protein product [Diatraea saccharalis]
MHVMYTEPPAQYRSIQPQSTHSEYQPDSPARHQPAKKRRVLSPSASHLTQQQVQTDNTGYKVMKILQRVC